MDYRVIKGGKLIDGTGSAPVENATVIVKGTKIEAVGRELDFPHGAEVIDATGKTVMPGLIDSHIHHTGFRTNKMEAEEISRPKELTLIKSIDDSKKLLAAGFTTVKDCGGMNAVFLKKAVAEGTLIGLPRIIAAGYTLSQTFGHSDIHYFPVECVDARTSRHGSGSLICDGVGESIKATRYALREGADFIKIMATGGVLSERDKPADVQFNPDEIKAIVQTAAQVGKFVSAHCQNARGAKNAILCGVKTIDHATAVDDEVLELAEKNGAIFVSTIAIAHKVIHQGGDSGMPPWAMEKAKRQWEIVCESHRKIHRAGAPFAAATDYFGNPMTPFGSNAIELEVLVKYCGFSPMDAMVAATKYGAMACFMADQIGTIEPGKFADILIVDGDPLADIAILQDLSRIKMVMLEGRVEIDRFSHT